MEPNYGNLELHKIDRYPAGEIKKKNSRIC